jgi:hypothetical protein
MKANSNEFLKNRFMKTGAIFKRLPTLTSSPNPWQGDFNKYGITILL